MREGTCTDQNDHGTHVAGTIAAKANNGVGVAGVSFHSQLAICRALNALGSGTTAGVANCITYLAGKGVKIISMSLGGGVLDDAADRGPQRLPTRGTLIIAAAGNDGDATLNYPAAYPEVVSVAATDRNDARASFSNANADVEIAAAGVDVLSTKRGGGYVAFSGTSMATPHVAGVAAIIAARNPSFSGAQIRAKLQTSVDDLGAAGPRPAVRLRPREPERLKGRPLASSRRSAAALACHDAMRVHLVDPAAYTPPYDRALASALARAGAEVALITSRVLLRRRPAGARRRRARGLLPLGAGARAGATRGSRSTCRTCCATGGWRGRPTSCTSSGCRCRRSTRACCRAKRPRVLTAHDVLPREPKPSQLAGQRALYERMDAVIVHSEHGAGRLRDEVGLDPAKVHVIPHGVLDNLVSEHARGAVRQDRSPSCCSSA